MKKLMIAAAAAAMIGGAYADGEEFVYDLTVNVKTTKGKAGSDSKEKFTVNLGRDSQNNWWYTDDKINLVDGSVEIGDAWYFEGLFKYDSKKKVVFDSKVMNKLTDLEKAAIAIQVFGFDGKDTKYPIKDSKGGYCTSFKYTVTTYGQCYRVAGSKKFTGTYITGCCDDKLEFIDGDDVLADIDIKLLNFFGAQTLTKANKVEAYGEMGDFTWAGQGSTGAIYGYDADGDWNKVTGLKSLSGNIVGTLEPSTCYNCCADEPYAGAFDCANGATLVEKLDTAAYGTFTLKYNQTLTKKLNVQ